MERIREDRSLPLLILLSFVTCGIYTLVWIYGVGKDMNQVCEGDGEETPGILQYILFSLLTCGIYSFLWFYNLGNRQQKNAKRYGIEIQEGGNSVVAWMLIGILLFVFGTFIAYNIILKNMNALAKAYNASRDAMDGGMNGGMGGGWNGAMLGSGAPYQNQQFDNQVPNNWQNNNAGFDNRNGYPNTMGFRDSIQIENYPNTSKEQGSAAMNIICMSGELANKRFSVSLGSAVKMGRDASCNIRFSANTPNISRNHCTVSYNGKMWLCDNGSSCGTFLANGTRLTPNKQVPLNRGDSFFLGSRAVQFRVE